jgi:hypothetical protein
MVTSLPTQGGHPSPGPKPQVALPRPFHWMPSRTPVANQRYGSEVGERWLLPSRHWLQLGPYSTLASGLPLTSPQDEQVHFAHPIIASTAKSFYFDKWHAISTCDRETFNGSVPKPLIALIGAVVCFSRDRAMLGLVTTNNIFSTETRSMSGPMAMFQL